MKNVILTIVLVFAAGTASQARSFSNQEKKEQFKNKTGVMMMNDKAMLCKNKKCKILTATFSCSDGSKVSTDGTITRPDGSTEKLKNGYQIDKTGKVMMIPHGQKGHECNDTCPMHQHM